MQAPCTEPDTQSIMDQDFHPVAAFIGEQIRCMGLGFTVHLRDSGQSSIRPGPHIHRFRCHPDLIDTDHTNALMN